MTKYGRIAEQNNLHFIPAVFSHAGRIHGEFKALVKKQIRDKLIANSFRRGSEKLKAQRLDK